MGGGNGLLYALAVSLAYFWMECVALQIFRGCRPEAVRVVLLSKFGTSECRLCSFSKVGVASASIRDAFFLTLTKYRVSAELLVRSIRTAGCRARIVIFATDTPVVSDAMLKCGVTVVKVEPAGSRFERAIVMLRFEWYYLYLRERVGEFDRIFHVDSRDSFCYGDPFSAVEDRSKLHFILERPLLGECRVNWGWFISRYGHCNLEQFSKRRAVNAGALLGGSKVLCDFLKHLVTHVEWDDGWCWGGDQAGFNFLLYTLNRHDWLTMPCNCSLPSMSSCHSIGGPRFDAQGRIFAAGGDKLILFAHQYDTYPDAVRVISRLCGERTMTEEMMRRQL